MLAYAAASEATHSGVAVRAPPAPMDSPAPLAIMPLAGHVNPGGSEADGTEIHTPELHGMDESLPLTNTAIGILLYLTLHINT
jgi:hypothetical protein